MSEELDEAQAIAELAAASILNKLHPILLEIISHALLEELTESQISKIHKATSIKKQVFRNNSHKLLCKIIQANPMASEEHLKDLFAKERALLRQSSKMNDALFEKALQAIAQEVKNA